MKLKQSLNKFALDFLKSVWTGMGKPPGQSLPKKLRKGGKVEKN